MKKRQGIIGPGAASLLLVIVVVSMSVLGLLALMSARSDAMLAQRMQTFAVSQYVAMDEAERMFAELDGALAAGAKLPEDMVLDGDIVSWTVETAEGQSLLCEVRIAPEGETPRCTWLTHAFEANAGDDGFAEF